MVVLAGRNSGAFDESLLVGAVVLESGPEKFGLSGLEIARSS